MAISIEHVGTLFGHNGWVTAISVGKDSNEKPLLVSGGRDKKVIVWNLNLENPEEVQDKEEKLVGKPLRSMSGHNHFVSCLDITRDSKYAISGSWDKTLRLWDLTTFKTRQLFVGHEKDVLTCAISPDNRCILSGGMDNTLRYWNIEGKNQHTTTDFEGWVSSLCSIRKEKETSFAVGSWDCQVRLFDSDYKFSKGVSDFQYGVVSMSTDDDGEFLFTAEKNGKIHAHALGDEPKLKNTIDVNADINAISYDSKYFSVISVATNKGLAIHEVNKSSAPMELFSKGGACISLAWDHTKTYLFAGFADGAIRVYKYSMKNE